MDTGLSSRLTERLKQYRKSHGLTAGNAARSLHLESGGTAFRGHFILAVPVDLSAQVVADGAFAVEDLGEQPLEEWHRLQVEEYLAALAVLETPARSVLPIQPWSATLSPLRRLVRQAGRRDNRRVAVCEERGGSRWESPANGETRRLSDAPHGPGLAVTDACATTIPDAGRGWRAGAARPWTGRA